MVTVLLAVYNGEKYLKAQIESILSQIRLILGTRRGEVLGNYNFGCGIEDLIFSTKFNKDKIKSLIQEQISENIREFPNYSIFAEEKYKYIVGQVEIKDNAVNVINKLHDEGNEIIFITARHYGEYDDPYEITFKYLSKHGINFDKIITNRLDKGKVCKEENIDLFIDDSVSNCKMVSEEGIDVLLFDAQFNKNDDKFKRVYNWDEVYNIINQK